MFGLTRASREVDFDLVELLESKNPYEIQRAGRYCSALRATEIGAIGAELQRLQNSIYIAMTIPVFVSVVFLLVGISKHNRALSLFGAAILAGTFLLAILWAVWKGPDFDRRFRNIGKALLLAPGDDAAVELLRLYRDTNNRMFRSREREIFRRLSELIKEDPSRLSRLADGQAEYLWRRFKWLKRRSSLDMDHGLFVEAMDAAKAYQSS